MKIISVDNYDRKLLGHDDRFLFFIQNEARARKIVDLMNEEDHGDLFFKAVPHNYELRQFQP